MSALTVAVFSDVHGNLGALDAILTDLRARRPDLCFFAGDLALFGARPEACVARLRAAPWVVPLHGNTDRMVFEIPEIPEDADEPTRARYATIRETALWARDRLNDDDLRWLDALPFAHRVSPTARPADDLLLVHANPKDVNRVIAPCAADQQTHLGEVRFDPSDLALAPLLEGVEAGMIAYGHLHLPGERHHEGTTLANISAASLPLDGDTRARYGWLTWTADAGWRVEMRALDYDLAAELRALEDSAPPDVETLARQHQGIR